MRLTNIVWTTAIIAAAILLTAVLSTASLHAQTGTEAPTPVAPRFLSQTGLYGNAAALKIDSRNQVLSASYPLWTDGTAKRRWVRLPVGSQIDVADLAGWELPVGTKFWKEFRTKGRKIETRFLWQIGKDRWVVASYVWNDAQTDAELISGTGVTTIADVAALGK